MAAIVFSPKASEDLDNIKEYIEKELKSPIAANNRIIEILDAIDQLVIFPEPSIIRRYRSIPVNPHFEVQEESLAEVAKGSARTKNGNWNMDSSEIA